MLFGRTADSFRAEIQFDDKSNHERLYLTGETVSGKLILHTAEQESISIPKLSLSFVGNLIWISRSKPTGGMFVPISDVNHRNLHKETLQLSSINDHCFTFAFTIPSGLPPSTFASHYKSDGYIGYFLVLTYIHPKDETQVMEVQRIHVSPCISPSNDQLSMESILTNRDGLYVRIHMNPGYVSSSKPDLPLEITIENPKKQNIKQIKCQLIQKIQSQYYKTRQVLLDSTIPDIFNSTEKNLQKKFTLPISATVLQLPPTYVSPHDFGATKEIHIFYTLKIECCVSGFNTNIKFKIPIFISNN